MSRLFEHLDSQIFCHHSCDQNPESIRFYLHAHDKLELFYFISGNVDYIVEGAVYQLTPGDIVITHSAEVHQPIIHPGAPYERISIQFDDALSRDIDSSGTGRSAAAICIRFRGEARPVFSPALRISICPARRRKSG